jgi:hypothetical protein
MQRSALLLGLLFYATAYAECPPAAHLSGEPALVSQLQKALEERGISIPGPEGCPAVEVWIEASAGALSVILQGASLQKESRTLSSFLAVVALVEVWSRLDADLVPMSPPIKQPEILPEIPLPYPLITQERQRVRDLWSVSVAAGVLFGDNDDIFSSPDPEELRGSIAKRRGAWRVGGSFLYTRAFTAGSCNDDCLSQIIFNGVALPANASMNSFQQNVSLLFQVERSVSVQYATLSLGLGAGLGVRGNIVNRFSVIEPPIFKFRSSLEPRATLAVPMSKYLSAEVGLSFGADVIGLARYGARYQEDPVQLQIQGANEIRPAAGPTASLLASVGLRYGAR